MKKVVLLGACGLLIAACTPNSRGDALGSRCGCEWRIK
jgi:hypothetical protein